MADMEAKKREAEEFRRDFESLTRELKNMMVGMEDIIESVSNIFSGYRNAIPRAGIIHLSPVHEFEIFIKDVEGRYLHINPQYETLFHVKLEEITGKTDADIFPEDIAKVLRENDIQVNFQYISWSK